MASWKAGREPDVPASVQGLSEQGLMDSEPVKHLPVRRHQERRDEGTGFAKGRK